jgi:protein TonB
MAQSLAMRATSLMASATLLALAGIAAVSIRYAVTQTQGAPDLPPIISIAPTPPVVPPTATARRIPQSPPAESQSSDETASPPTIPASTSGSESALDLGPATILSPRWLQRPGNLGVYYPRQALRREREGAVDLDCLVTTTGLLQCRIVSETPANWGFGEAALRIAADHRMVPATRAGVPVEGRYRMHVPFQLGR